MMDVYETHSLGNYEYEWAKCTSFIRRINSSGVPLILQVL